MLFVDDDVQLLRAVERMLTSHGFDVLSTNSPMGVREAIAQFRPDLVLVDVNIPLLKGDELVAMAKAAATAAGLRPRFVLYSGLDDEDLAARTKHSGADGWISKEFPIERLPEKVRSLMP